MLQVDVPFIRCEVIYHGLANGKEEGSRRRSTNTFSSITRHPSTSTAVYSAYRPPFGRLSWEGDFSVVKKITTTIERRQSGCEALSVTRSPYPVNLNCLANNNNNKSKKIKKPVVVVQFRSSGRTIRIPQSSTRCSVLENSYLTVRQGEEEDFTRKVTTITQTVRRPYIIYNHSNLIHPTKHIHQVYKETAQV